LNVLSLFDGKYEVTSSGKVFSNVGKRKELKGKVSKSGYRMMVLTVNGKKIYPNLHRLVAESFIPNPKNYPEVNHKDGNKLNNNVNNLEWCTPSQNQIHSRDNDLQNTKINMEIANEIRELYSTGSYTYRSLAKKYDIGKTEIGYIIKNKRWCI
jgi:hypothetical protein